MEAVSILDSKSNLSWDYDGEGDVLYISVSSPRPALSIDIGEGLIVRYDESRNEVVGVTIVGLREKTLQELSDTTHQQD